MSAKRVRADAPDDDVVVIKKYANRRLYNTGSSSYVTLDDLRKMVQRDVEFRVVDAKSEEDLTRAVLTQIIVEEESRGQNLLPISFLRQIISMYEDNMRWTLPQYLETVMGWYGRNQQELQRTQMALLDRTMRMFNPLAASAKGELPDQRRPAEGTSTEAPSHRSNDKADDRTDIDSLRDQITALQKAVETLARKSN